MSISKIKHSQSENDSLVCCIRLVHVSRLKNPFSLQLIVDFNVSNAKIKHPQSENDKIKPVGASGFQFFTNLKFTQP